MRREFWQSHDCSGYWAKISIEWRTPTGTEDIPPHWAAEAEIIAEEALDALGSKPREIVQAMRGKFENVQRTVVLESPKMTDITT